MNKVIFFDLDGTLLDVQNRYYEIHKQLCDMLSVKYMPKEKYWTLKRNKITEEQIMIECGANGDKLHLVLMQRIQMLEKEEYLIYDTLHNDILKFLNLVVKKYTLHVITYRKNRESLLNQLQQLGISQYFKLILSIGNQEKLKYMGKVNLINSFYKDKVIEGFFFGDTEVDILAGKHCELVSIGITQGIRTKEILEKVKPDFFVNSWDISLWNKRLSHNFMKEDRKMNLDKSLEYYSTDIEVDIGEKFVTKSTIELVKNKIVNKAILNLGLGNGKTSLIFDKMVKKQVVIEGSKKIINTFSFESQKTTFIESYFENYAASEKFDVVLANHVLEHVDNPIMLMKEKFHEWLCDDGIAFITVPNAKSIHRMIGKKMGMLESEYDLNNSDIKAGHQRVYDVDVLKEHIKQANLEIVEIGGYNLKMVSLAQMRDWNQELLDAIFEVSKNMPPEICANIWVKVKKKK